MDSALMETIAIAGGLVGVESRDDFGVALTRHWRSHERNRRPLSLLLVEIDFFVQFQGLSGITASDECLDGVATVLLENARQAGAQVFAWGPGRFAVILPETGRLEAEQTAAEIRFQANALVIPHPRSPVGPSVTISVALATTRPAAGASPYSFVDEAEMSAQRRPVRYTRGHAAGRAMQIV